MARPAKTGLDYFPLDVGFLRDKKVRLLRAEFGASSVLFVLYVLGKAYEGDGYFLRWDKDEELIAADELRENPTYISEVLQGCLKRSLFDERVFQMFGILTSAGIQRRYLRSCEKRDDIMVFDEYWLLNVDDKKDVPTGIRAKLTFSKVSGGKNPVNSPGNPVNSPGNPESKVKESKVKESKVKESKVKESKEDPPGSSSGSAVSFYLDRVRPDASPTTLELLAGFEADLGPEVCIRAMMESLEKGKANWSYIHGILRNKRKDGIRSLAAWDANEARRKKSAEKGKEPWHYDPGSLEGSL